MYPSFLDLALIPHFKLNSELLMDKLCGNSNKIFEPAKINTAAMVGGNLMYSTVESGNSKLGFVTIFFTN